MALPFRCVWRAAARLVRAHQSARFHLACGGLVLLTNRCRCPDVGHWQLHTSSLERMQERQVWGEGRPWLEGSGGGQRSNY